MAAGAGLAVLGERGRWDRADRPGRQRLAGSRAVRSGRAGGAEHRAGPRGPRPRRRRRARRWLGPVADGAQLAVLGEPGGGLRRRRRRWRRLARAGAARRGQPGRTERRPVPDGRARRRRDSEWVESMGVSTGLVRLGERRGRAGRGRPRRRRHARAARPRGGLGRGQERCLLQRWLAPGQPGPPRGRVGSVAEGSRLGLRREPGRRGRPRRPRQRRHPRRRRARRRQPGRTERRPGPRRAGADRSRDRRRGGCLADPRDGLRGACRARRAATHGRCALLRRIQQQPRRRDRPAVRHPHVALPGVHDERA